MKDNDLEVLKDIEEWTGHAEARLDRNIKCMLLGIALSMLIAFGAIIYFIIQEWPS